VKPVSTISPTASDKQGLVLDKVVLLGRTFEEYARYFALDDAALRGQAVLDVASGVSSFCAEANALGIHVTAFDLIYELAPEAIEARCGPDLDHVIRSVVGLKTYKWDFYKSPEGLRPYRERAYKTFLADYRAHRGSRYVRGSLPELPFREGQFDLTLSSYLLFAYEDHFGYEFHKRSVIEMMRVTRGEARFYPLVNFETHRCSHLDPLKKDPDVRHLVFEEVQTDFEFLVGSNWFLRVRHQ
jgi:SAM-dependent methyltransferase